MNSLSQTVEIQGERFRSWFGSSIVTTELGEPRPVFRGEHGAFKALDFGCIKSFIQTRLGSIAFGSARAANIYAMKPNSFDELPISPRVMAAYLSIKKPVMNRPNDPFVELTEIAQALGTEMAKRIAMHFRSSIMNTNNWCDNIGISYETYEQYAVSHSFNLADIYFDAYALFDDHRCIELLKRAGFDGAVYGGTGETFQESEFRVFQIEQIWPRFTASNN